MQVQPINLTDAVFYGPKLRLQYDKHNPLYAFYQLLRLPPVSTTYATNDLRKAFTFDSALVLKIVSAVTVNRSRRTDHLTVYCHQTRLDSHHVDQSWPYNWACASAALRLHKHKDHLLIGVVVYEFKKCEPT